MIALFTVVSCVIVMDIWLVIGVYHTTDIQLCLLTIYPCKMVIDPFEPKRKRAGLVRFSEFRFILKSPMRKTVGLSHLGRCP